MSLFLFYEVKMCFINYLCIISELFVVTTWPSSGRGSLSHWGLSCLWEKKTNVFINPYLFSMIDKQLLTYCHSYCFKKRQKVVAYFRNMWQPIKSLWALFFISICQCFFKIYLFHHYPLITWKLFMSLFR